MNDIILNRMQTVSSDMILPDGVLGFDATTFIPVELGESIHFSSAAKYDKIIPINSAKVLTNRPHAVPVMELGKRLLQYSRDGNTEAVRELMGKGAPFSTDWLGTSPLHFAAQGNHVKTCEVLLRAGISKDARTKVERTPLHMAAYEGHAEVVELLLKNGADVNAKDMLKMTPLHWAVQNEHEECIKLLINYGAAVDVVNKFDKTPLSMAIEQDRMDLAQLLQIAMKLMAERMQNLEIQRATLAATQSLTEELINVSETPPQQAKDPVKVNVHPVSTKISTVEECSSVDGSSSSSSSHQANNSTFKILENSNSHQTVTSSETSINNVTHTSTTVTAGKELSTNNDSMKVVDSNSSSSFNSRTPTTLKLKGRKLITLRSDQFFALTGGKYQHVFKKFNGCSTSSVINSSEISIKPLKRIVMTKNKITVSPKAVQLHQVKLNMTKIENLTKQLNEARRIAEEYKQKYKQKEKEIEEYERQLKLLKVL